MGITKEQLVNTVSQIKDYVDSHSGTEVTVSSELSEGVKIATIDVDGTSTELYAPESSQVDIGTVFRKETVLWDGALISAKGTYTLKDSVSNYDEIYIEFCYLKENNNAQAEILKSPFKTSVGSYQINHGNGTTTAALVFHFSEDQTSLVVDVVGDNGPESIRKIVGYNYTDKNNIYYTNNLLTGNNYSEEEKVVGSWTNGKPVYRRCFVGDYANNAVVAEISSWNIDLLANLYGTFSRGDAPTMRYKFNTYESGTYSALLRMYDNAIRVQFNGYNSSKDAFIAVEYTKTTDEENSFNIGMLDTTKLIDNKYISFEDYSDEEQVIGRWTDGKPLYRKTVYPNVSVAKSGLATIYDASDENIDTMVSLQGWRRYADTATDEQVDNGLAYTRWMSDSHTITARNSNTSSAAIYYRLVLEYTKTTDGANSFDVNMLSTASQLKDNYSIGGNVYSEDEVVVGKWIDGKPIYRGVYEVSSLASGNNYIDLGANCDTLVTSYGNMTDGTTNVPISYNCFWSSTYSVSIVGIENNTRLRIYCGAKCAESYRNIKIVVEYTKTADAVNSFKPEMLPSILVQGSGSEVIYTDEEIREMANSVFS